MGDTTSKIAFSGRHHIIVATIGDAGREDHIANIDLMFDRLRQAGGGLEQWGMLPAGVTLSFDAEPVQVPAQVAVAIALIVNECLTNAAKHAFPDGLGAVAVWLRPAGDDALITIEDDGTGQKSERVAGTGSKLIDVLARTLAAEFTVTSATTTDRGTRCELRVPLHNNS